MDFYDYHLIARMFGYVGQIKAGTAEDLPLQFKANKDAGAHFLVIEMALA